MSHDDTDIFIELGIQNLPAEQKLEFLEKLERVAKDHVLNLILEELNKDDIRDLDDMLQSKPSEDDVLVFLKSRIENLDEKITERIQEFKQSLIDGVKQIQEDINALTGDEKEAHKKQKLQEIQEQLEDATKRGDFKRVGELVKESRKVKES